MWGRVNVCGIVWSGMVCASVTWVVRVYILKLLNVRIRCNAELNQWCDELNYGFSSVDCMQAQITLWRSWIWVGQRCDRREPSWSVQGWRLVISWNSIGIDRWNTSIRDNSYWVGFDPVCGIAAWLTFVRSGLKLSGILSVCFSVFWRSRKFVIAV